MKTETNLEKPKLSKEEVQQTLTFIANDIKIVSDACQVLNKSKLRRSAIVTLIQHQSKLPRKSIEIVMNNLESLATDYLKP